MGIITNILVGIFKTGLWSPDRYVRLKMMGFGSALKGTYCNIVIGAFQ
jgi:hypothetical protein